MLTCVLVSVWHGGRVHALITRQVIPMSKKFSGPFAPIDLAGLGPVVNYATPSWVPSNSSLPRQPNESDYEFAERLRAETLGNYSNIGVSQVVTQKNVEDDVKHALHGFYGRKLTPQTLSMVKAEIEKVLRNYELQDRWPCAVAMPSVEVCQTDQFSVQFDVVLNWGPVVGSKVTFRSPHDMEFYSQEFPIDPIPPTKSPPFRADAPWFWKK